MSMYSMAQLLDVTVPSMCAICSVLFSTFVELSASPFALVCSPVTLWCSNPNSSANNLRSVELNGGPLADSIFLGIPCVTNIFLSLSQGTLHDVDVVCSTTENVSLCQSPLDYSGHQDMVLQSQWRLCPKLCLVLWMVLQAPVCVNSSYLALVACRYLVFGHTVKLLEPIFCSKHLFSSCHAKMT